MDKDIEAEREGFGRKSEGLGRKHNVLCKVNSAVFPVKSTEIELIFYLVLYYVKRAGQSFTKCKEDIWGRL